MDPAKQVKEMLREAGATLLRSGRHLVYRLPNGAQFYMSKTPSDRRGAAHRQLSTLRKLLGEAHATAALESALEATGIEVTEGPPPPGEELTVPLLETVTPDPAPPVPVVHLEPPTPGLRERLEQQIVREEQERDRLLGMATEAERRAAILRVLLPLADDPDMEPMLLGAVPRLTPPRVVRPRVQPSPPAPQAIAVPKPPPHLDAPPDSISDHVAVTKQLVYAAALTFDTKEYTVDDVVDLMMNRAKGHVADEERRRIRSAIVNNLKSLYAQGYIRQINSGTRGAQAHYANVKH